MEVERMRISAYVHNAMSVEVTMNKSLESEIHHLHAEVCAALADPKRIMLIYELAEAPKNVTELSHTLDMPQPLVSRHLKILREQGMVTATRLGPSVEYRLADERLVKALDLLRAVLRDQLSHRAKLVMSHW
jgi:ArsR family transcriptional regulator